MDVRVEAPPRYIDLQPDVKEEIDDDDEYDVVPFPTITSNPLTPEYEKNGSEYPFRNSDRSSSLINLLAAYEKKPNQDKDAGNKPLNHYKLKLPAWRNSLRNALLPFIREETPYLAALQRRSRNVVLDLYFAMTANLGTHTFYVIMLPVCFWYGGADMARSLVFVLAFGVYVTGVIKDLLCLPRPLSPPLHRLTMSGSAALEYGFPSTHSANAVSVGLLMWDWLKQGHYTGTAYYVGCFAVLLYVFSITWGRIHCGMHGFCDVVIGSLLGAWLWWIRATYGASMDRFLTNPESFWPLVVVVPVLLGAVWIHPEPVDDCPCFDDAVAFIGVVIGVTVGQWHFAGVADTGGKIPYSFEQSGVVGSLLRLVIGIALIGVWRPVMKRALHAVLPPLYRFIEGIGISLPRRYFTPASQYEDVPSHIEDATFFEPYQLTSLFSRLSKARRSDSVGPQSTADVYESMAYREYQRQRQKQKKQEKSDKEKEEVRAASSAVDGKENYGSTGKRNSNPPESPSSTSDEDAVADADDDTYNATVVAPRVRYDVEVVTKLIVYAGIGIIATDFNGILFVALGI